MNNPLTQRRHFFQSAAFGLLAYSTRNIWIHQEIQVPSANTSLTGDDLFYRYPAIHDDDVSAVVGAAHANLAEVKRLVKNRPELAKAGWDWGFGDYESAIGAADHMGRKDIALFLIEHGATPTLFTFAMMGELQVVQSMIEAKPGIQRIPGPHGITLLQHAKNRLWHKDISAEDRRKSNETIKFLESLAGANQRTKSLAIEKEEQKIYIGEYRWGNGDDEIFEVRLNRQEMLSIERKGTFGRVMHKVDHQLFSPGGAPSVRISFVVENGVAQALTIHEPNPVLTAKRIE